MLTITLKPQELWDHAYNRFRYIESNRTLRLEHSLKSISNWEAIFEKTFLPPPYLDENKVHIEPLEWRSYFKCMVLDEKVSETEVDILFTTHRQEILEYIARPNHGTKFGGQSPTKMNNVAVSSGMIYYWLTAFQIPFHTENWHLNRLLALLKIANIKNDPNGTMTLQETKDVHRSLNAERRSKYMNHKG